MKNYNLFLSAALLMLSSCGVNNRTTENNNTKQDTLSNDTTASAQTEEKGLIAKMQIKDIIKVGEPLELKFTVYNTTDSTQQFCKWHTPFEPLMSKYLEVKADNGEEAAYQGPMAKRIMPPPADSYIKLNAKDSLSVNVDLGKAYAIKKAAKYTLIYTGQNMSGLIVKDSVTFTYAN